MKNLTKLFCHFKNTRYICTVHARNKFFDLCRCGFFIGTSIGYHSDGYYTERSVIVPCRTEKGSLSSFNTLIFRSCKEQ